MAKGRSGGGAAGGGGVEAAIGRAAGLGNVEWATDRVNQILGGFNDLGNVTSVTQLQRLADRLADSVISSANLRTIGRLSRDFVQESVDMRVAGRRIGPMRQRATRSHSVRNGIILNALDRRTQTRTATGAPPVAIRAADRAANRTFRAFGANTAANRDVVRADAFRAARDAGASRREAQAVANAATNRLFTQTPQRAATRQQAERIARRRIEPT